MAAIALLLITTGCLKLAGLKFSPIPAVGELSSPRLMLAVACWELVLGFWLLLAYDGASWLAAVATFTAFAAASAYFGMLGVSSCGCFGAVKASPWAAFALDLTVLGLLALLRPRQEWPILRSRARAVLGYVAVFGLLLAILAGAVSALYGSVPAALARLRGEPVVLSASYLDFGSGKPGTLLKTTMMVTNFSDRPVRLIGGTSDCSCSTTDSLPLTIAPGGRGEVVVKLRVPPVETGQLTRAAWIWTDHPQVRDLRFRLGCRVE